MVVIFGWGRDPAQDRGEVVPVICPNCHNQVYLHLVRSQKKFSLYFIPIAGYGTDQYLLCPVCSQGLQLRRDQVPAVELMLAATTVYRRGQAPEAAYRARVDAFWPSIGLAVQPDRIAPGTEAPAVSGGSRTATGSRGGEPAIAERLTDLARLHATGVLTDEEFVAAKRRVLEG